jgi:hypothetical protein
MKLSRWKAIAGFFLAAVLSAPAFGANTALPGTLNYVEGQAQIGSQNLTASSVGSAELQPGQSITTENGRAEILLTPGVFLRLDDNSAARMVSPSLTSTEVELDKGRATVEVAEIHKQNDIKIAEDGATTQVLKNGLYEFNANQGNVQVFDGKARVQDNDKSVEVKGGRELDLNAAPLKAHKFDKKKAEDDFYNWSALRSQYESEANVDVARIVPSGYVGPGWFWDPWFSAYTFVPGDGIFYSPFGWGFYSPAWIGYAPIYYGIPYHYYGHGYRPHASTAGRAAARPVRPAPAGAVHAGGFGAMHSGAMSSPHMAIRH